MKPIIILPLLLLLACVNGSPQVAHGRDPSRDKPMAKVKKKAAVVQLAAAVTPPVLGSVYSTDGVTSYWADTNVLFAALFAGRAQTTGSTTGGAAPSAGSTTYWPLWSVGAANTTVDTSATTRNILSENAVLTNLFLYCTFAPGLTRTHTVTMLTNGVSTTMTASISGLATKATNRSAYLVIQAGTEIGVSVLTAAGSPSTRFSWSVSLKQ